MSIKGYLLDGGVTVVADELEQTKVNYMVTCPVLVFVQPNEDPAKQNIQMSSLIHFMQNPKDKVPLNKSRIISTFEPQIDIQNMYSKNFGSGLIRPDMTLLG